MSGIYGVWRKKDPGLTRPTLEAMCAASRLHPSERSRVAVDTDAGVAVTARFANQQVWENSRVLVACDAELCNLRELAGLLNCTVQSLGQDAAAAAIAGLYERFGTPFVEKLRGGFSVIIRDRRERNFFAATDGFGIATLVYYDDPSVTLVGSRIDGLLASDDVAKEVNVRAIANYFNYTVNIAPETIFARVTRLLPGTCFIASDTQTVTRRYWDMQYNRGGRGDEAELSRELEAVVEESVRVHCGEASSALGAFLSGGTDSSTVAGLMRRVGQQPVRTFSIGYEEQRFNELDYARIAARHFQTEHNEYLVNAHDCAEALPGMIRYFDEPFGNSSAIPTYFCARLAAERGVGVLLAGDGGDELFGGNERYLTDKIFTAYHHIPRPLRTGVVESVLDRLPFSNGVVGMARSYVRRCNLPPVHRFFSYNMMVANAPDDILEAQAVRRLGGYSVLEVPSRYYAEGPASDHLDRLLYVDVKMTLGDNDLLKVTRMSEMAGVRPRFPFLDRSVAEMSGRIPARLKVRGRQKRYLFKRAFRNLLPDEILRKKKHGFGIPVAAWMKSDKRMRELTRDFLLSARSYQRGYVRRDFIEDLFRHHETDQTAFYGDTLWTFLTLELWFRQYVDAAAQTAV